MLEYLGDLIHNGRNCQLFLLGSLHVDHVKHGRPSGYECGGYGGTPCQDPDFTSEDEFPIQECTDIINNQGCVKQFVDGVLLRQGCWLDGTNKCLKNDNAEVCTCSGDLCNKTNSAGTKSDKS
eukprot:TRINITY_DN36527_c0_g1_i1.p1 TRINITY_DN36527_c0_g1~~TRINITY_DN36527_c0_g1_i1.p1  ORF type:complete len:123 (-),score=21.14 TRINITY_DN36527_c0_g1_i1:3-371(-)